MTLSLLAIDTSGARLQLALAYDGKTDFLVKEVSLSRFSKGFAEIIFAEIADLLKRNDFSYQQLERICVATGPGSFTGLRVGIATAQGLGLGLDIEVLGLPNLLALSLSESSLCDELKSKSDQSFTIMIDARRDEVFVQNFIKAGVPKDEPVLLGKKQAEEIYDNSNKKIITNSIIDMKKMIDFAYKMKRENFPASPCYIRQADAKISTKGIVF